MAQEYYGLEDVIELFDTSLPTIAVWTMKGLLPEPVRIQSTNNNAIYCFWKTEDIDRIAESGELAPAFVGRRARKSSR